MTPTLIPTPLLSLAPSISATLTPTLLPMPTEVIIQASPIITLAATSAPVAATAGSLSTLFWAVLILLGGAILGIFGFLMGQGGRSNSKQGL
jgi:hypothetical protein